MQRPTLIQTKREAVPRLRELPPEIMFYMSFVVYSTSSAKSRMPSAHMR